MDRLFIYITLGIGAGLVAIVMYFVIQNLYLRLRLFASNWMRSHPDEVTEIKIKLDDLACAIERQVDSFKLKLSGRRRTGGIVTICTDETLSRRQMEALYSRESKNREMLAVAG